MGESSFTDLYAALARLSGRQAPILDVADDGSAGFSVFVDGVMVQAYSPGLSRTVFFVIELGSVPQHSELAVWRALMEVNFHLLNENAPRFSRRPATGEVLLQCAYPLDHWTVEALLPEIARMAGMAGRWRKDYFLSEAHDAATEGSGISVRGQLA